jgi:cytochrome c oxidase subunit 2
MTTPTFTFRRTVVAAAALLVASAVLAVAQVSGAEPPEVVTVTAHRFEFSPSQLTLVRGKPVVLRLTSLDVTHGFFSKPLGLDELIEPGKVLDVPITPGEAGRFTVICDHFCGAGHGNMKMVIEVK